MIIRLDARRMGRCRLHSYLAEMLPLPEYYGRNLDALHDWLTEVNDLTLVVEYTAQAGPTFGAPRRVLEDSARENPGLTVIFAPDKAI